MPLLEKLHQQCTALGLENTYWVAYSGGLDSHVLLHTLKKVSTTLSLRIRAIHIHHGLSPNADLWAMHCAEVCAALAIPFISKKIQLDAKASSVEDTARLARYAAIQEELSPGDILMTAQHQDDQAETLLLQLLRGAGPQGLAAMPEIKVFGSARQVRPFLNFSRQVLQDYAAENNLQWINDESNANTRFARNFIRHAVVPVLLERWPKTNALLARSAQHCAEVQELLAEISERDLALVQGPAPDRLSVAALLELTPARQRQVLRFWLQRLGLPLPNILKLRQIQAEVLQSRSDAMPMVAWTGAELRRFRGELYAQPPLGGHDTRQIVPWEFPQTLVLPGLGNLIATEVIGEGLAAGLTNISVRFRQGGESCRIQGRNCTHLLKKLLHAWHIPHWERNRIPLIYVGDELAAAPDLFIDEKFAAKAGERGFKVLMRRS